MAQIENVQRHSKNKTTARQLRVDLTPMVDLGFLLITFFILATAISQPTVAKLVVPKDSGLPTLVEKNATLTLMLIRNDSIEYYEGNLPSPGLRRYCSFNNLRDVMQQKKKTVAEVLGDSKKTVIIIYPGNESTYKNFIDVLDEIQINDIKHYFVMNQN